MSADEDTEDQVGAARGRRRRAWALCGVLVLAGVITPTVSRALSPRMAAGLAVCEGFTLSTTSPPTGPFGGWTRGHDAWGNRVRLEEVARPAGRTASAWAFSLQVRSMGPDGRDDGGHGDDLVLSDAELALTAGLNAAPVLGVLLAAALAWCLVGPFTHPPRDPSGWRELARAAGLAGLPGLLVLGAGRLATLGADPIFGDPLAQLLDARATPGLLVSPGVAFVLAYAAIALAVAHAWRVTRPADDPDA